MYDLRMLRLSEFAIATVVGLLSTITLAQSPPPKSKSPMDSILVYGQDFVFSLKEPQGWRCTCGPEAAEYGVNAILFPSAVESRARHVQIRVRVNDKVNENTAEDLNVDMREYKKEYPKVEFADLDIAHPEYRTHGKVFQIPNDFYEYVAYVNPGPGVSYNFSVAMSKEKVPATTDELAAYTKVLKSLNAFGGKTTKAN
jgi:hypothetical protein